MAGNIVFIDDSYDYNKRVFSNPDLVRFNYVSSRKDVENRIKLIKYKPAVRDYIVNLQRKDTEIDKLKYCNDFVDIISREVNSND